MNPIQYGLILLCFPVTIVIAALILGTGEFYLLKGLNSIIPKDFRLEASAILTFLLFIILLTYLST